MTVERAMVGRDAALASIEEALRRLRAGQGRAVAIAGERGLGKSRLLREVGRRADAMGLAALSGRGRGEDAPFGMFIDALEHARITPPPSVGSPTERHRRRIAAASSIEEAACAHPVLLALDDVHAADEASEELLAHLLRRATDHPLLVVAAYRPRRLSALLAHTLADAAREGRLESIELGPLSAQEADALLGDRFDSATRRRLYEESGGNPFYLEQLAHTGRMSPGIRSAVAEELARLSEPARSFLRCAAVVGERFDFDLAAETARLDEPAALDALDELVEADLVQSAHTPRGFTFRYAIVGRAVYESSSVRWRREAHARVAAHLAVRGMPATDRAYHVLRSARPGDERAIATLVEAAELAAAGAPATAARWYRGALRLLPDTAAERGRRVRLTMALGSSLADAGHLNEGRAALLQALELAEASVERARIVIALAQTEAFLGREAGSLLAGALRAAPDGSAEHAALTLELAVERLRRADRDDASRLARAAARVARTEDDRVLRGAAAALAAVVDCQRGALTSSYAHVVEAREMLETATSRELGTRTSALVYLAIAEEALGNYEDALRVADRARALCEASGQAGLVVAPTLVMAASKARLGRLDEAAADAGRATESAERLGIGRYRDWAAAVRCFIAGQRGDPGDAARSAEQVGRLVRGGRITWAADSLEWSALAEAWLLAGDPERCRRELLEAAGGETLARVPPTARVRIICALARAELQLGRTDRAEAWLGRAATVISWTRLPALDADVRLVRAELELAHGRAEESVRLALDATGTMQELGLRVSAARARLTAARALAASADGERAAAQLERAAEELAACGAQGRCRDAEKELRRLRASVGTAPEDGYADGNLSALTPRQREIAMLVAEGHSNREIADRLYLSERTVESHISRAFRKLGVPSRAALARLAGRVAAGV